MEVLNSNIKRFIAFSGGAFFFALLIIRAIGEYLISLSKLVVDLPGLYNFREDDFAKIENKSLVENISIPLGQLPMGYKDTKEFILPSDLTANEIYVKCSVKNYINMKDLELDYTLSINNPEPKTEFFYFFLNSLSDKPDMSFDTAGFWIKKPVDNKLSIKCSGIKPANTILDLHTKVEIIKIR